MPDEPAGQNVATQAQELGADILAKLDALTRSPETEAAAPTGPDLERRKQLAQEAIGKMKAVADSFIAEVNAQNETAQQARDAGNQEEIERIKASIGA